MKRFLMSCLAALAAVAAKAEDPFAAFVKTESGESAPVRMEARTNATVAAWVVTGTVPMISSKGVAGESWNTTKVANGWHEVTDAADAQERVPPVELLVLNAPGYQVEGGRIDASTTWTAGAVHWVRNTVVVSDGVTLRVMPGTVVKFGEGTGIKVEAGGTVDFAGTQNSRVALTHFADDDFGGDSDFGATNAWYGSWSVSAEVGGTIRDAYTHVRYGTVDVLPTITLPASVTALRTEGMARIPVTLSGTRSERMALHWRVIDGTAKFGTDYTTKSGNPDENEEAWSDTSSTTQYFEIPLMASDDESVKTFRVVVTSVEDANPNPQRLETTVTIISGTSVPVAVCTESAASEPARLENRAEGTLGKAVVCGVEYKASGTNSAAVAWDTTVEPNGWQTLAAVDGGAGVSPSQANVLVVNDAKVAVEGGRLKASVCWTSDAVHLVRQTVVVPDGVTLTVSESAVVKFCENTGIIVEAGGNLKTVGTVDRPVVFTSASDDTVGGDTDRREAVPADDQYAITVLSGGGFTDSFTSFRHVVMASHATVSIPEKASVWETDGEVRLPVSVSGSRASAFRVFWRVADGSAKHPADFTVQSGVLEWANASEGTKYIVIPVLDDGTKEGSESFRVELFDAQGANISRTAVVCEVTIYDAQTPVVPIATYTESAPSEPVRLENRAEGTIGKAVACGVEYKSSGTNSAAVAWDTTVEANGWQTLTAVDGGDGVSQSQANVLVVNDAKVAVQGGRLTASTVWDSNAVHLVRQTVVVPSGVTLSVTTNAVVKFCENTGVKVEAGGRFLLLGSLDENVYMTLANDDTVGGDTDKDEEREWVEGAATYSVDVVSGGTFTDMNSVIRGTTIGTFGYASVNAKTVVDAAEGVIRIPVFVNGSRTTQFSVDWKTSDGLRGQMLWSKASEGTKWVTLNVADCSEKFTFELCECRGINIDGAAKVSEVIVFNNATPLAVCAESESSAAVRIENRADGTFGKALCFGTEWKSADGDTRAVEWDTTQEEDGWQGDLLVLNDASVAVEGGRIGASTVWTSDKVHVVRNWVVVPNGVTLTIESGTVVKFAEFTGFKVEVGGRLNVEGSVDAPVVYTAAADDTIGGDTDKREVEPQYGDYAIDVLSGGTYNDRNCAIRYATFSNLGTASLPTTAVASEKDGVLRVPILIDTSRTTAFSVDWRVADVTYAARGCVNWNTYKDGVRYIELPLKAGTVTDSFDTFEIELYESQGINVSTEARKCQVTIYADDRLPKTLVFAESTDCAAVRMENRDPFWSYGAEIVCGTELKSANGESRAEPWDTTQESDGWFEVRNDGASPSDPAEFQLLVRNDPTLAIEGGRVVPTYSVRTTNGVEVTNWNYSVTWSKDKVHVVRNWVVVPNGVTLVITAGTVVKFCDETGIKVEAGGRLVSAGTSAADVILTSINDDTVGGDTDFDEVEAEPGDYWIDVLSGGTFADTYTQMRYGESSAFGSVSIASSAVAKKDGGVARIPLTISTSRTTPFSVDWVAHDGTAIYGEDYLCASGRIDWTSSSQGTKYLEIPLDRLSPTAEDEWFEVELITGLGINLNLDATLCEVELYDTKDTLIGDNNGYAESAWATPIEVDGLAGSTYPLFAQPEEIISYSTLWQTNGADGASVKVTYEDMEGNVYDFLNETGRVEGQAKWKVGDDVYGRYRFRHQVLDEDGKQLEIQSQDFIVSEVVEHGGAVRADETWDAGHVHVVRETVTVLRGATLTIEPGAIVKFFPGTGITTQDDGECIANGAQFTHVADDQLGGDTFFDGGITAPGLGEYTLSGNVRTDVGTETRYAKAQVVSANISADTTWGSHTVYHITKSITVTKPAILTIQAGAVVKLADGVRITVNSGATLDVQGTRAAPVVFTSIKDDDFGGDSNQDGSATAPKNGIWDEILNSGTLRMSYAHVLYGGYGQYSNQGDAAIRNTGGTATLDCCVVEGSDLRLLGLSGGTMTVRNSVLRDGRWGWEGNVTCINGVVENCTTGASGGKATNTIFWNCPTAMSGTTQKNCVAFACDGGTGTALIADPKFADGPAGDYRIGRDSPCVDAGDEEGAPETDYYGQSRAGVPDIGLYEVQLREAKVDVDLAAVSVSASEKASIGGNLTVTWSVKNVGSMAVADAWRDKLELIDANGATVVLGTYTVTGGLAADGARVFTGNFRVPSMSPGAARLRLKVNAERDVFEGSQTDNNVISAENTVQIALPSYTSDDYSKLTLVSGTSMALSIAPEDGITALIIRGGANIAVFGAAGYVPAGLRYDVVATRLADGSLLLSIPSSAEGDFMFTVENGGASSATVEIEAVTDELLISEASPMRASNTGDAYVTIRGVGLDSVVSVRLEGLATYSAQDLQVSSSSELTAQFNLNGASVGMYSVVIETEDGTTARIGGFEIYKPKTGPKLEARLEIPSTVRQGRIYTGKIIYSNVGDTEMYAPFFSVVAKDAKLRSMGFDEFVSTNLHVMGIASSYPAGILYPGSENEILFEFMPGASSRFSLEVEDDDGLEWSDLSPKMSEAATILNRRGRLVVDFSDLHDYVELCANTTAVRAACGHLISKDGTPAVGASVCAIDGDDNAISFDTVDENGVFVLDRLEPGAVYGLKVLEGAFAVERSVSIPMEVDLLNISWECEKTSRVFVSATGVSDVELRNAVVYCRAKNGMNMFARPYVTLKDAPILMPSESDGSLVFVTSFGSYLEKDVHIKDDDMSVLFDFSVVKHLAGQVIDDGGIGIRNACVTVYASTAGNSRQVYSDENGCYTFYDLPQGDYVVAVSAPGYEPIMAQIVKLGSENVEHVNLTMERRACVIEGVASAVASRGYVEIRDQLGRLEGRTTVDENGLFVARVSAGHYEFKAYDPSGHCCGILEDVSIENAETVVEIPKLETVPVEVRLKNSDGATLSGKISFVCANGFLAECELEESHTVNLPCGEYWICVHSEECADGLFRATIQGACSLEMRLDCGDEGAIESFPADCIAEYDGCTGVVSGRVVDSRGNGLNANMRYALEDGTVCKEDVSDTTGFFATGGVPENFASIWIATDDGRAFRIARQKAEEQLWQIVMPDDNGYNVLLTFKNSHTDDASIFNTYILLRNMRGDTVVGRTDRDGKVMFSVPGDVYSVCAILCDGTEITVGTWPILSDHSAEFYFADVGRDFCDGCGVVVAQAQSSSSMYNTRPLMASAAITRRYEDIETINGNWNYDDREYVFNHLVADANDMLNRPYPDPACEHNLDTYNDYCKARDRFLKYAEYARCSMATIRETRKLNWMENSWEWGDKAITTTLDAFEVGWAWSLGKMVGDLIRVAIDVGAAVDGKRWYELLVDFMHAVTDFYNAWADMIAFLDDIEDVTNLGELRVLEQLSYEDWSAALSKQNQLIAELGADGPEWERVCANVDSSYKRMKDLQNEIDDLGKSLFRNPKIRLGMKALGYGFEAWDDAKMIERTFNRHTQLIELENEYDNIEDGIGVILDGYYNALLAAWLKPYHNPCTGKFEPDVKLEDTDGSSEIIPYTPPSFDPNEVAGPLGVGENRYVKPGAWMDYTVYFENASDAEAAALDIYVTNPLSEWLDWSTFEMGDVSFNNQIDSNLRGAKTKSNEVPQNGTTYYVNSSVVFDEKKGIVNVEMHIVDHTTKYGVPEDPYAGILPPNDETHCGEGYFSYRVKVREDAPTGVQIDNSATIIFDFNDPIETDPAWWNTVGQTRKIVFSVDGVESEIEVFEGEAFGELPDPGVGPAHCSFGGWFTGPNGTGMKVSAITLVSAEITTLYPYWLPNVAEVDGVEYEHFYEAVAQCPYDADEFSKIALLADFEATDGFWFEYPELSDGEAAEIEEYGHWTTDMSVGYKHWQYFFGIGEDRILGVSYREEDWSFFTGQKVIVDLNGHRSSNAWIQVDCADVVIRDTSPEKTGVVSGDLSSSIVDAGSLTLESGRLFLGNGGGRDDFGLNIKNQGNGGGGFFNFLGGEVVAKDGLAAVSVGSNCVVSIGGTAVATNAAGNVVLDAGSELNLASDFTGRVGITTDNDVEGSAIGLNPSGFAGAENLYCDGDPSLRGRTTDDGLIVWERVGQLEKSVGRYVKLDIVTDLGIEIPSDVDYAKGDKVTVKVEGLAKGLKVVTTPVYEDPEAKRKVIVGYKYTIEGVPTEEIDFETRPMYARVTTTYKDKTKGDKGKVETLQPIVLSITTPEPSVLTAGVLNEVYEPVDIAELWPEVKDAKVNPTEWSFKGWPSGVKYTTKDVTKKNKDKSVTTNAVAYSVYGTPTKAGVFPITATRKYKLADGKTTVSETFSAVFTVWGDDGASDFRYEDQAYVATATKALDATWKSFSGLPTGIKYTTKLIAADTKKGTPEYPAYSLYGTPTKAGVFAVTATKVDPNDAKKTVKETFLWKVAPATAPTFALDTGTAPIVDLKAQIVQGANQAFAIAASAGAKVSVSGLPSGLKLVQNKTTKLYSVEGVASKPGEYFVTFKTVLNGVTTVTTTAFTVQANPFTATYYGYALARPVASAAYRMAVAEVTVAAAGTVKLTYTEGKTKYTASVKSFEWSDATGKGTAEGLVLKASSADKQHGYGDRKATVTFENYGVYLRAKLIVNDANGSQIGESIGGMYATVKTTEVPLPASQTFVFRTEDGADTNAFATVSLAYDAKKATAAFSGKLYDGTAVKATVPVMRWDDDGKAWDYAFAPFLVIAKDGTVCCFNCFTDDDGGCINWVCDDGEWTEGVWSPDVDYPHADKKFAELVPEAGTFTFGWGSDAETVGAATEPFTFEMTKDKNNKPTGVAIYDVDPQPAEKPIATVTAKVGKTTGAISVSFTSKKGDKAKYAVELVWRGDQLFAGHVTRTWKEVDPVTKKSANLTAYGTAEVK